MVLCLQPLKTFLGADPRAKIKTLMEEGNFLINYIVGKIRSEWFNSWILYSIIKVLHTNKYVWIWGLFNLLGSKPTKWSNTLKKSVDNLLTNCFSVFDHFGLLARKVMVTPYENRSFLNCYPQRSLRSIWIKSTSVIQSHAVNGANVPSSHIPKVVFLS